MMLITAIIILVLSAAGLIFCLLKMKKEENKKPYIIGSSILGALCVIALVFVILNGIFLSSRRNQPPDNTDEDVSTTQSALDETESEIFDAANPVSTTFEELISTRVNHENSTHKRVESTNSKLSTLKPSNHPDPLGFTKKYYDKNPVLRNANEISVYILNQFISGSFDMTFYIPRNEFYAPVVIDTASQNARAYYLFGSYHGFNCNTEDKGAKEGVTARFTIRRYNVKTDIEAFKFALDYVKKHPVPRGGFTYESEKKYMREIHDYIIRLVEYDPMGYDPNNLIQMNIYDAKQEAYNALIEKSAVCAGYAKAVSLIAQTAGIDCAWIRGNDDGSSSHAWNVVYPCDGSEPVVVDATWDDHENPENPNATLDKFFYLPVSQDTLHSADESMWNFLEYMHR